MGVFEDFINNEMDDEDEDDLAGYRAMVWTPAGPQMLNTDGDWAYADTQLALAFMYDRIGKAAATKAAKEAMGIEDEEEDYDEWSAPDVVEFEHDNSEAADATIHDEEMPEELAEALENAPEIPAEVIVDPNMLEWWAQDPGDGEVKPRHGKGEVTVSWQGNMPRATQRFTNTVQLSDYLKSECVFPASRRYSHRPQWSGSCLGLNWEGTLAAIVMGWEEGVEKIVAIEAMIKKVLAGALPEIKMQYDTTGLMLDMGKWVNGEPEDYLYEEESEKPTDKPKGKVVKIVTTFDVAGQDAFVIRGAAICAVTNILERYGYRVQVDAHIGSNDLVDTWIRVKEASWPVNYTDMAFFTAHPAMFYRVAYGCWELLPKEVHDRCKLGTSSMGWISEPRPEERGDVYVSALASAWCYSEKSMLKWVCETLTKNGIEVDMEKVEGL